jgi:hypothetical protein
MDCTRQIFAGWNYYAAAASAIAFGDRLAKRGSAIGATVGLGTKFSNVESVVWEGWSFDTS